MEKEQKLRDLEAAAEQRAREQAGTLSGLVDTVQGSAEKVQLLHTKLASIHDADLQAREQSVGPRRNHALLSSS